MRKLLVYTLILCLAGTMTTGCGKKKVPKEEEAIPVKVMKVKLEKLSNILEYIGNIEGQDEVQVYPKVTGKIIEKVKEEGSDVAKGEVIAYIDRDEIGLKFEKAPIESPLSGMVGRVYVDIGSNVTTQTPVALISNMDIAEINLDIPEKYIPKIKIGQEAEIEVDAYTAQKFTGKITKISPVVDIQTRAAPIEISIDNPDHRLQSGMFAKVNLVLEKSKGVPAILKEAIIGKNTHTYIYVVEGNKAVLRNVELGIRQGQLYEVVKGVKEGDLVVIMGQQRLRDGALVIAEE